MFSDPNGRRKTGRRLAWIAATMPAILLLAAAERTPKPQPQATPARPSFVGSRSCRECHERFYRLWAPSHHGKAMQPFTREFASENLLPNTNDIVVRGQRFRADIAGERAWVSETGPAGTNRYEMVDVMGGKNVYYFLTPLDRGRLQVLPVAFDVKKRTWYDTTASMVRHFQDVHDEALDWRDPMLTFNTACFNCHVSQLSKNYDPETDTYHTVWKEPGINCETCHGPAEEHVRVCRETPEGTVPKDLKIIVTKTMKPWQRDALCAPCHAKMRPLTDRFQPGERYFDHYDVVTLEDRDFYPDGRDLGENYTYTSWLMSPCEQSGQLECNHCHTPSGRFRFAGTNPNHACLPCHAELVANGTRHSHHKQTSQGNECVSCHMPMTAFAQMHRSDHSMRPPTPSATLAFKSPNACNICHTDKDAAWADAGVRAWYKEDYQAPVLEKARLFQAAREGNWSKLDAILKLMQQPDIDPVLLTSFVRVLESCPDARKWPVLRKAATHPSPLIRSSAVLALQQDADPAATRLKLDATRDGYRVVRIKAAMALLRQDTARLSEADRASLKAATDEYLYSLTSRPDDWSSHYNLGNFYTDKQDLPHALAEFRLASKFRPDVIPPLVNRSMIHARLGENAEAEKCLRKAVSLEPNNATANFNLALLVAEKGDYGEAEGLLHAALKAAPGFAAAAYNLGVLLSSREPREAIAWCRRAARSAPDDPKYAYTLAFYLARTGQYGEAETELRGALARFPEHADSAFLLGNIYERQERADAARKLYRGMIGNGKLPGAARSQAEARLRALSGSE